VAPMRCFPLLALVLLPLLGCPKASPTSAPPTWAPCEPISEQEQWGVAIDSPEQEGFTLAQSTEHFAFWVLGDVEIRPDDPATSEAHLALMEGLLGVDFDEQVRFFVYPHPETVIDNTGMDLVIRRDLMDLHLVNSRHLHEVTHLVTYDMAGHRSVPLFEEGFAEAHGNWAWRPGDSVESLAIKDWSGEHVHAMTAAALDAVPPLVEVLEDRAFRTYQGDWAGSTYVFAASFDLHLIDRWGMPAFTDLLKAVCVEDPADVILAKFESIYPVGLTEADLDWRASLCIDRGDPDCAAVPAP
jgi:hypothetical protein